MGYINMRGKKLAVVVAVVLAIIAAAKGSMAQTPPAVPMDCVNELFLCVDFTNPSSQCCKALDRAYYKFHSCLCTYFIDDWTRNTYLGYYASCKIKVPQNICMPGENPVNSGENPKNSAASLLKDKTAIQKTTLIAVSTFLGFFLF